MTDFELHSLMGDLNGLWKRWTVFYPNIHQELGVSGGKQSSEKSQLYVLELSFHLNHYVYKH